MYSPEYMDDQEKIGELTQVLFHWLERYRGPRGGLDCLI